MSELIEVAREVAKAVRGGSLTESVRLLEGNRALLDFSEFGGSWLHLACRKGHSELAKWLVDQGLDVNMSDDVSGTPIHMAAMYGHLDTVQLLLTVDASLDTSDHEKNPLYSAIYSGHQHIVEFLLTTDLDIHTTYRTPDGGLSNALSFAEKRQQAQIVDLLKQAGSRMPVEGVDIPINDDSQPVDHTQTVDSVKEILEFLSDAVGPVEPVTLQEIVPVHDDVHVSVNVIKPNENCPFTTIFTTGMSEVAMTVPEGQEEFEYAELLMYLPGDWDIPQLNTDDEASLWPFQWLRNVAYLPHQEGTWLGGPHTIISSDDPPVPLGPNTDMTCLLLNADMMDWSPMELSDGRKIRFYTVMPIYTEERDFETKNGIVQLLQKFEEIGIPPILLPGRPNVTKF